MTEKKLTNRQQIFVNEYLQCWNATEAAKTAGYSAATARQQGSRLLTNVDISAAISDALLASAMSADEALMRLSEHARGSLAPFVLLTPEEFAEHPKAHLVKKFKRVTTTFYDKDGEPSKDVEVSEIEIHDPQAALNTVLKEQRLRAGLPTDRDEHTGKGGQPLRGGPSIDVSGMTDEQLRSFAQALKD